MHLRSLLRGVSEAYTSHGGAVARIGFASVAGIIATFVFQVVSGRALGPADYGTLSAFFSIVTMAAYGSAALQNAVAVQTARSAHRHGQRARLDGFTVEALILGGGGAAVVGAASPWIASALDTSILVPVLGATSVLLSFVFARAVGAIQGAGRSESAVWWTTISLVLRTVLLGGCVILGWGLAGALVAVIVGALVSTIGALAHALRLPSEVSHKPFRPEGLVVMALSLTFAWATNVDVILVRATLDPVDVGLYGAAATLVKTGFLVPSTLSLYLLPRFVKQERNAHMTRAGVRATVGITGFGALLILATVAFVGPLIVQLLYGPSFQVDRLLMSGLAAAYIPWVVAQGVLIRVSAIASPGALAATTVVAVVLPLAGLALLPDITTFLLVLGAGGCAVLVSFLVIDSRARRLVPGPNTLPEVE